MVVTELPSFFLYATVEAKINGKQLLNNISTLTKKFDFSFGFQMAIEERVEQVFYVVALWIKTTT